MNQQLYLYIKRTHHYTQNKHSDIKDGTRDLIISSHTYFLSSCSSETVGLGCSNSAERKIPGPETEASPAPKAEALPSPTADLPKATKGILLSL